MNKWLDSTVETYINNFGKSECPVVWEVGSRDGHDGYELAQRVSSTGNMDLHLVEPNPDQARICEQNYPNAEVYEVAASNAVGTARFMVYEGNEGDVGSSSLNLKWKEAMRLPGHVITVKTDVLENMVYGEVDIMKIDVEGHSLEALEGLGDKLKDVKVLHVETETGTGSTERVTNYMVNQGFRLAHVQEEWGGMPDQVWVQA